MGKYLGTQTFDPYAGIYFVFVSAFLFLVVFVTFVYLFQLSGCSKSPLLIYRSRHGKLVTSNMSCSIVQSNHEQLFVNIE